MFTVASGATIAILFTSSCVRYFPAIFTMPFFPTCLLGRFVATDTMLFIPLRPRMSATSKVALLGMWSITVPSFIADIVSSFFILPFLRPGLTMPFLPVFHWLPAQSRLHALYRLKSGPSHQLLAGDAL